MQIKSRLLKLTLDILKESSLHGVQNILRTQFLTIKILWSFCLLCSASYFFYSVSIPIAKYLEYDVDTKIQVKQVDRIEFPQVKNLFKSFDESFQKNVGIHNLTDILISCIYNLKFCNSSDFTYYYDYSWGSCWQFNSGFKMFHESVPKKFSRIPGMQNGLLLELYCGKNIDNYNSFSFSNALSLLVSNETFDATVKESVPINPGFSTHLTLDKYRVKTLPRPYTYCVDNLVTEDAYPSECYKKTFQQAVKRKRLYHYEDCSYMCFQKRIQEKCKCKNLLSEPYFLNVNRDCVEISDIQCCQNVYAEFLNDKKIVDACDCPRECHKTDYSVTLSYANYPTLNRGNYLVKYSKFPNKSQITQEDLEKSIMAVNIYYNDLKEIIFTQSPKMGAYDLFSKIGAQMSIFLGLNMLSFVEIFEFILCLIIEIFRKNNRIVQLE